ncbi:MAG TPA: ABC transporter permease [Stellaceae bacterium]|nr:ABC transporter permease [Stellaceae bacterium]
MTAEPLGEHPGLTWPALPSRAARAWKDLADGFAMRWLWTALAVQDIRLRYRGSILGPLWLTVSTLILATVLGTIYSHLLVQTVPNYVPYLLAGLVLWQMIVAVSNDGCMMFLQHGLIHQVPLPYSVHAYRLVCRNFLVLAHNAVVVAGALLLYRVPVGWGALMVLPGLAALALNALWVSTLLGLTAARFGDIPPIVASFMQVIFFVTPIFWAPETLGRWRTLAACNPYFAVVDVVRAPLLGVPPEPTSWPVVGVVTVLGGGIAFLVFARFRTRIPYWL